MMDSLMGEGEFIGSGTKEGSVVAGTFFDADKLGLDAAAAEEEEGSPPLLRGSPESNNHLDNPATADEDAHQVCR